MSAAALTTPRTRYRNMVLGLLSLLPMFISVGLFLQERAATATLSRIASSSRSMDMAGLLRITTAQTLLLVATERNGRSGVCSGRQCGA